MIYVHRGVQDRLREQGILTGDSEDPRESEDSVRSRIPLHSPIPTHQPTIAIDFDGRICQMPPDGDHPNGPIDLDTLYPREGTREAIEHLYDKGARIIVWTARDDLENIEDWLDEYRIPYHYINDNPDQPTNSRKVVADLYLDDRGEGDPSSSWNQLLSLAISRMGDKLDAWTKRPKYGTVRHLVITGPSGAGKTTLSGLLSEALDMPVWKVDQERLWKVAKPFRDTLGRYPSLDWFSDKDEDKPHGWGKMVKKYRKTLKRLVRKALKKDSPTILEGCHFLVCPGTLRGHKIVLLDPPEQTVINQRLMRDQAEGKLKPDGSNYTEREAKARFLYQKLKPAVDRMRAMDGVEVLQPHKIVSFVKQLMEEMGAASDTGDDIEDTEDAEGVSKSLEEKDRCRPGQSARRTGCTPASAIHQVPSRSGSRVGPGVSSDKPTPLSIARGLLDALDKVLPTVDTGPDYQKLFYSPDTNTAWWVSADGDEQDEVDQIVSALRAVDGIKDVRTESEGYPPKGEGYVELYPTKREYA